MVYILHFSEKLSHAQHYIGSTKKDNRKSVVERVKRHRRGETNALVRAAVSRGIDFNAYIIGHGSYREERAAKNRRNSKQLCPECKKMRRKPL